MTGRNQPVGLTSRLHRDRTFGIGRSNNQRERDRTAFGITRPALTNRSRKTLRPGDTPVSKPVFIIFTVSIMWDLILFPRQGSRESQLILATVQGSVAAFVLGGDFLEIVAGQQYDIASGRPKGSLGKSLPQARTEREFEIRETEPIRFANDISSRQPPRFQVPGRGISGLYACLPQIPKPL